MFLLNPSFAIFASCSTRPLIPMKNGRLSHVMEQVQFIEMFCVIHVDLGVWSSDFESIVDPILGVTVIVTRCGQSTLSVVAKKDSA